MGNIIKSGLYKLFKDWTFKITLIVGAALAVFMNLIYFSLDLLSSGEELQHIFCNGQYFLFSSLSPVQNFGLTVPINLIVFTVGEFTCGTIRNKVIAGYKKSQIYFSLLLIGLIFTFSLMIVYVGLSTAIASALGGFDAYGETMGGLMNPTFLWQYLCMGFAVYIFIVSFAIFVSTAIRGIGGSLPIVIIFIMMLYLVGLILSISTIIDGEGISDVVNAAFWINPLQAYGTFGLGLPIAKLEFTNSQFAGCIITPIYWAIIFGVLGLVVFNKKDIK